MGLSENIQLLETLADVDPQAERILNKLSAYCYPALKLVADKHQIKLTPQKHETFQKCSKCGRKRLVQTHHNGQSLCEFCTTAYSDAIEAKIPVEIIITGPDARKYKRKAVSISDAYRLMGQIAFRNGIHEFNKENNCYEDTKRKAKCFVKFPQSI